MTKLIEPVADTMLRLLQTGMNPIIDKISAEYATLDSGNPFIAGKSIPLPHIDTYLFGTRLVIPQFPCVIVDPETSDIDTERFHYQWADYSHGIMVDVLVQSDDEDAITRQVARYGRAVWEVLFGNQQDQLGNQVQAISIRPKHGGASALVQTKEGPFMRGYRWQLEVGRYDDLT